MSMPLHISAEVKLFSYVVFRPGIRLLFSEYH